MIKEIDYTELGSMLGGSCGKDAMKWATAFIQYVKKYDLKVDEDLLLGWFANSMEQMQPVTPLTFDFPDLVTNTDNIVKFKK